MASVFGISFGIEALGQKDGLLDGFPAAPYFLFGAVAAFGALANLRRLCSPQLTGHRRIGRHCRRMCLALFIATASFFLNQAQAFSDAIRHFAVLSVPVIAVLAITGYWLLRVLRVEPRRARD